MKRFLLSIVMCTVAATSYAQAILPDSSEVIKEIKDSIFIAETEKIKGRDKVLHAEPLFIDLIRDLGARKGEREWNIGFDCESIIWRTSTGSIGIDGHIHV